MKLYETPEDSYIRIIKQFDPEPYSALNHGDQIDLEQEIAQLEWENRLKSKVNVPIGSDGVSEGDLLYFSHIDGMYSLCYTLNSDTLKLENISHISASTEVEIIQLDELFTFEQIREKIGRAGHGKDGKGEYRESALKDMSDEWVKASINYVPDNHPHRRYYINELDYRKNHNIIIPDIDA